MSGILGRVEVDCDLAGFPPTPTPMPCDDTFGERFAHAKEFLSSNTVLKARKRRLACQRGPIDGIAINKQFMDGIIRQASGIVAIGVATRHRKYPLPNQLADVVDDLGAVAFVFDAFGQESGQSPALVGALQENRSAIGAAMMLVKSGDDGPGKKFWKDHTLCSTLTTLTKASLWREIAWLQPFYHREACLSSILMNNAG